MALSGYYKPFFITDWKNNKNNELRERTLHLKNYRKAC